MASLVSRIALAANIEVAREELARHLDAQGWIGDPEARGGHTYPEEPHPVAIHFAIAPTVGVGADCVYGYGDVFFDGDVTTAARRVVASKLRERG